MPPSRRGPQLTEADIPLPLDRPERSSFDSQAAFDNAVAEYPAAAAQRMKERRKMKERLREQKRERSGRDRSGRDQSGRARPSDAGAKEVERRRKDPEAAKKHREREAARYEAKQPEVTEEDISLTRIVDAGEERPNWEYLKGAKVSERARKEIAKREAARKAANEAAVSVARREAAEAAAREEADPEAQARKRQRKADEEAAAAARHDRFIQEQNRVNDRDIHVALNDMFDYLAKEARARDGKLHGELLSQWKAAAFDVVKPAIAHARAHVANPNLNLEFGLMFPINRAIYCYSFWESLSLEPPPQLERIEFSPLDSRRNSIAGFMGWNAGEEYRAVVPWPSWCHSEPEAEALIYQHILAKVEAGEVPGIEWCAEAAQREQACAAALHAARARRGMVCAHAPTYTTAWSQRNEQQRAHDTGLARWGGIIWDDGWVVDRALRWECRLCRAKLVAEAQESCRREAWPRYVYTNCVDTDKHCYEWLVERLALLKVSATYGHGWLW